jgi:hypothetical protein
VLNAIAGRLATTNLLSSKRLEVSNVVTWTIIAMFIVVAATTPFLPDYETYEAIYESGGGHLATFGRDSGFVLLNLVLVQYLTYVQFRVIIIMMITTILLLSLRKLQASLGRKLDLSLAIALAPIFLLKFGVQIREGLALCLWFSVLFYPSQRRHSLGFVTVALLSASIHLATTPLWGLLAIARHSRRSPHISLLLAIIVYATFACMVADPSRLEMEAFSALGSDTVSPDLFQLLYWSIFPSIMFFSIVQGDLRIPRRSELTQSVQDFAFVLKSAMIGLNIGIFVRLGLNDFSSLERGLVADLQRIEALVLMFLCVFLAIRGKKRKAILISIFLVIDTVRIILAA